MAGYTIVRLQGVDDQYAINKVYEKRSNLENQPYQFQHAAFLEEKMTYAGGLVEAMDQLGNRAHEIFHDCQVMQECWARENGVEYEKENWKTTILLEQLKRIKPDVVLFQDIFSMPQPMRIRLQELVPSVRLKLIQKGYPGETRDLSDADILLVSSPVLLKRYAALRPHLVYHPFDDSILQYLELSSEDWSQKQSNFSFLGGTRPPEKRYWMLRELLEKTDIQIWGMEHKKKYFSFANALKTTTLRRTTRSAVKSFLTSLPGKNLPVFLNSQYMPAKIRNLVTEIAQASNQSLQEGCVDLSGLRIGRVPRSTLKEMYPDRCHEPLFGIAYYKILRNSKIVFNIHSAAAENTVDNMKMFETTGVGACLLTDTGVNMKDLFVEDEEIVTYRSVDEAIDKVKYLIDNPELARQIGSAGQARTLRDHTVMNRCQQIDEIIQTALKQ